MPGTRQQLFIVNERQRFWWLEADQNRRSMDAEYDRAPGPTEPQRERSSRGNRLAFRLRMLIRPATG